MRRQLRIVRYLQTLCVGRLSCPDNDHVVDAVRDFVWWKNVGQNESGNPKSFGDLCLRVATILVEIHIDDERMRSVHMCKRRVEDLGRCVLCVIVNDVDLGRRKMIDLQARLCPCREGQRM